MTPSSGAGDDLRSRVLRILADDRDLSEQAIRQRLIGPLLNLLGWDLIGGDVEPEYPVERGQRTEHVDFCLQLDGVPRVFVEAKKPRVKLSDDESRQVIGYAALERVKWAVLTNGHIWKIFNAEWGKMPSDCLYREVDLKPDGTGWEDLQIISKKAVMDGSIDRAAGESQFERKLDSLLQGIRPQLEGEIVTTARNRVFDAMRKSFPSVARKDLDTAITTRLSISFTSLGKGPLTPRVSREEPPSAKPSKASAMVIGGGELPVVDFKGLEDGEVVLCPSTPGGVEWMLRHGSWGYVRISGNPRYLALYVSGSVREIRFLAEVDRIVEPDARDSPVKNLERSGDTTYKPGKRVIVFKSGSLARLAKPIPLGPSRLPMQNHRYTTLRALEKAKTTDDLRGSRYRHFD